MKTTHAELVRILNQSEFTIVHIDAEWDGYRKIVAQKIDELRAKTPRGVAFAYIDCDDESDYANQIGLRNTPAVAYYLGARLVSTVIGISQDVSYNLALVMAGGVPDASNTISRK